MHTGPQPFTYTINPSLDSSEVASLFRMSGLSRPTDDIGRIDRMIANANLTIAAYQGERLIGIARSVTDFAYCCYLSDLAVDAAYQRQGIGKVLIAETQKVIGDEVMLLLCAAPKARTYYPHVGFEKMEHAWFLNRKR